MPFDTMTLAAVVDEVQATTSGGRIQRIIQPAATSVALSIYSQGDERWLLLSADARAARVHLSSRRLAKAAATPPPFVMLLRKHLEGSRVAEARQLPGERVFVLECVARGDRFRIVAEIMGKHSNVILVSQEERVLGAVKLVSPRQSRVRPVLPGQPYEPPPAQARDAALYPPGPRIDPHAEPDLFASLLAAAPRDTPLRSALLGLLAGASPFLVGQIALRAGEDGTAILGDASVDALLHASRELYGLYASREWNPSSFRDARGRPDFAPFRPRGVSNPEAEPTMSVAIERAEAADVNRDALSAARDELLAEIGRASRGAERKVASLRQGLEAAEGADDLMKQGQLLLAYQHAVRPGSSELALPELDVTIPLDPLLSAKDNAERLFRRYRKLRDAGMNLPPRIAEAEAEAARLTDLAVFARLATAEADLRALRSTIHPEPTAAPSKKPKREKRRGPARYRHAGYTALVGKNAQENEEVTFRLAGRDDLWLHARERTGAHVVVQGGRGSVPPEVVESAARLAAYFSESRSDSHVDVDVTAVRNVRKIPGGPPGRVTYRNFQTLRVEPGIEDWEPVIP